MSQDLTHMAATETGGKENETYIYIYMSLPKIREANQN